MGNKFNADMGGRGGSPSDFGANASMAERGSFGSEQNPSADQSQQVLSSAPVGNPHSSRGFRRALMKSQRSSSKLADQMPSKMTFGGKGYKKPNYFGQGGARHGMHIGSGAPYIGQNQDGADFGGN